MREAALEQRIKKITEKHGGLCWKFTSPSMTGVPDRICLFPGGHVVFVELKRPGRLSGTSAKQDYVIELLTRLGFNCFVVDDANYYEYLLEVLEGSWNAV